MIGRAFGRTRTAVRLARAGLHLGYGIGVVACIYPFIPQPLRLQLRQRWSRQLLDVLGVRLQTAGSMRLNDADLRGLVVANHISWLDIYVINAVKPPVFVSKAEVRDWPLIGWLCAKTDTLFLERGSRTAAQRIGEAIAAKLAKGELVAVFPEGTTSDGSALLRFRAALLQAAIDTGSLVQPLALRYTGAQGEPTTVAAYCGETTLWQSLCSIASAPALAVRVDVLPLVATRGKSRRELAEVTHALIGATLSSATASFDEAINDDLLPAAAGYPSF